MTRLLRALMIVLLLLTGGALGTARGQAQLGGQVVLCTGSAVTLVSLDREGKPVEQAQFCPDMALALLAAVATPDLPAPPMRAVQPADHPTRDSRHASAEAPRAQARDPPFPVLF